MAQQIKDDGLHKRIDHYKLTSCSAPNKAVSQPTFPQRYPKLRLELVFGIQILPYVCFYSDHICRIISIECHKLYCSQMF